MLKTMELVLKWTKEDQLTEVTWTIWKMMVMIHSKDYQSKTDKAQVNSNNKGMTSRCNVVNDEWSGYGVDTAPLVNEGGVPGILLRHEDTWWFNDYFHHHHTASDTIDHVDPALLKLNLECVAAATWLCANTEKSIPRLV